LNINYIEKIHLDIHMNSFDCKFTSRLKDSLVERSIIITFIRLLFQNVIKLRNVQLQLKPKFIKENSDDKRKKNHQRL